MDLKERVAQALGWTVEEVNSFSYQSLRDLVRPVSPKLAAELAEARTSGAYITANQPSYGLTFGPRCR